MKDLKDLVRTNIWELEPYSSARDEFHGSASVFLDANENPYNEPYNRYPDPLQWELKDRIAYLKEVDRDSIFLGNGSDEAIDLIIRASCEPGLDTVISIAPSYGMYEVAANINKVSFVKVPLDSSFDLNPDSLLDYVDEWTKMIFLCSPNNPTGNNLNRNAIYKILKSFRGIVVLDEAYIDFSDEPSFLLELKNYPNLIVLQTLSKAWGAAGLRLGMAFASPEIIAILNKIKYPYNVNMLTQMQALEILNNEREMLFQLRQIKNERIRLWDALKEIPKVHTIYPSDANFFLVGVTRVNFVYQKLVKSGIIVRNRDHIRMCAGCLRITVGTPEENDALIEALKNM